VEGVENTELEGDIGRLRLLRKDDQGRGVNTKRERLVALSVDVGCFDGAERYLWVERTLGLR
jgi:hypothetical protein